VYPNLFYFPDWVPLLGGAPVTSFGLFMFLAFVAAGFVGRAEMERKGYDGDKVWDLVFMAVVGGVLGAKIYYVLLNWPRLIEDPAGLVFSRGGMVWYGGFLGATALVVWEIRRSKLPLGDMADMAAPALSLAYAVGRIGCFLVGDDWGRPTGLPWGVRFPEGSPPTRVDVIEREFGIAVDPDLIARYGDVVPVHPTQLYEVGLSTLIFFALWRLRRHDRGAGWLFMLWLAMAGMERFLVEFLRAKDDRFFGVLTVAQVISLGLVAAGVLGAFRLSEERGEAKGPRVAASRS